jgi:ubiquinone/menaquinone biosynthesis C-methylase UbiE
LKQRQNNALCQRDMDIKKSVQKQFGDNAQNYVTAETFSKGYLLNRLLEVIDPKPAWRVLDIATGGGHTALKFARQVRQVVATDLTQPMLLLARDQLRHKLEGEAAHVDFARCDAEVLPFADGSFDLITCRIAPHHFPNVASFVNECARILVPGGLVAVVDTITPSHKKTAQYINAFERLRDPSHHWAYSREEWVEFFTAAGLAVTYEELYDNQQNLSQWAGRMGCSSRVIEQLHAMLVQAPAPAQKWLAPQLPVAGSGEAISFIIRQVILIGQHPLR